MQQKSNSLTRLLVFVLTAAMILSACASPTAAPTQAPARPLRRQLLPARLPAAEQPTQATGTSFTPNATIADHVKSGQKLVIRVSYHDVSNEFAPQIKAGVEQAAQDLAWTLRWSVRSAPKPKTRLPSWKA